MKQRTILKTMQELVEDNVIDFKSDFYDYDINTLKNMNTGEERIWSIRDTGTYFFNDPWAQEATMQATEYISFYKIRREAADNYSMELLTVPEVKAWAEEEKAKYKYSVIWIATGKETSRHKTLESAIDYCNKCNHGRTWENSGIYMYEVREMK